MKNVITPEQKAILDKIDKCRNEKDQHKKIIVTLQEEIMKLDIIIRDLRQELGTLQREQEEQKKELSYKPKITEEEALAILNKYSEEEYKRCRDIYFKVNRAKSVIN